MITRLSVLAYAAAFAIAVSSGGCSGGTDPVDSGGGDADASDTGFGDGGAGDGGADAGDAAADGGDGGAGDAGMDGGDGATGDADAGMDGGDGAMGDGGTDGGDGAMGDGGTDGGDGAMGDAGTDGGDGATGDGGTDGGDGSAGCATAADCDDGVSCTTDACDTTTGACVYTFGHSVCDDGLFCNGGETCAPGVLADPTTGCLAGAAPVCDDGFSCTVDTCDETADACENVATTSLCDDGLFCTGEETCRPSDAAADAAGCVAGTAPTCDDGFACTTDSCDSGTDSCASTPMDTVCDDGLFCTGAETCSPTTTGADARGCVSGSPPTCDDTFSCTDDVCDTAADACISAPIHTVCDNGLYCDGTESCDPAAPSADARGCAMGTGITCASDGLSCTIESCSESADACITTRDHASCGSGLVCTGGSGTGPTGCEMGSTCTLDSDCDDLDLCTGTETCSGGICQPGTPPDCSDPIGCTTDTCDSVLGCVHTVDDAACDNGVVCDGVEICDPVLDCLGGTPLDCNDGISCTVDSCSETAGGCVNARDDGFCDDGVFCNGAEACSATLDCRPGTPPTCNDGIACTDDSCSAATDACAHVGVSSRCADSLYCNGVEQCTVGVGCTLGPAIDCNDGVACSIDSCNETTDSCAYIYSSMMCGAGEVCTALGCTPGAMCTGPTASICDDGLFCNGFETCSSSDSTPGVCQGGTAPTCDDSNACTIDACAEGVGCTNDPRDGDSDGYGDATCGGTDCNDGDPSINPGAVDVCDGIDNDCDGVIDGGLASAGALCSTGADCCSDNCASGICVDEAGTCGRILDTCTADSECCTGLCSASVDGVLRCQVPGGCGVGGTACLVAADCCSTGCVGGFCDDFTTCTDSGGSCTTDVECCTHLCGTGGTCESAGPSCNVDGQACSSHGNCCSGFCMSTSTGGRCSDHDTCRGEGQICVTNGDCCHGGCDLTAHPEAGVGRCQFLGSCATSGESCTSVRGCCSALCVDAGSGVGICEFLPGCRPFGEVCSMGSDCCSDECGPPEGASGIRRCVNPPGCVDAGEICGEGGSNNCCVLRSEGCTPTGLGVSRCNDQPMCIPDMGMCDFSEQCCDGRLCVLDSMGVRRCSDECIASGGTCLSNADCCGGRCLDGICDDTPIGCIPVGSGTCVLPSDCCSGSCIAGICGSIGD